MKAKALAPCSCFKVKVAGNPAADEERLRAVHEAMPDAQLWIDANQSYTPSNALELLKRVEDIRKNLLYGTTRSQPRLVRHEARSGGRTNPDCY